MSNKKNGGVIPAVSDNRILMVPIKCGKCMECKKAKSRDWQIRLSEEIKENRNGKFVTLTFSNEALIRLTEKINKNKKIKLKGYELDNEIATLGVREFLERWRAKHKKSVRHWLATELGQTKTERIHIHGIIFTNKPKEEIIKRWKKNGIADIKDETNGGWVSEQTVNYIVKYISKADEKHKEYESKILSSKGIGKKYTETHNSSLNKYKEAETKETYTTRQGKKIALPIYYRNKIYTEEEKEKLWIEKLNKNERWVDGVKIDISKNEDIYYKVLEIAREKNKRLGYNDDSINWDRKKYEEERRNLIKQGKIELSNTFIYKPQKIKIMYGCKRLIVPKKESEKIILGKVDEAF